VAATLRFPDIPASDESEWQERVIAAVPVSDWQRIDAGAKLGVIGEVARPALLEHGLLWPFNAYVHLPIYELARGGAALTGVGGDELFASSRWDRLTARRVALALAPARVREVVLRRRFSLQLPWLSPWARAALAEAWARDAASEPRQRPARSVWRLRARSLRTTMRSLERLAMSCDTEPFHPFADEGVVRAFAAHAGPQDATRGDRLRGVAGSLLPPVVFDRRTKASFNAAFWTPETRAFAAEWNGEGVDAAMIDVAAVKSEWTADVPDGRTFTMLQAAWLSREEAGRAAVESSG
jgi:asparagine synthase (glutamine-hydrolysing)